MSAGAVAELLLVRPPRDLPFIHNAESQASGTTVSAANSSGTDESAFDSVTIGANMALTYDTTNIAHGTRAFKFALTSTATNITYMEWDWATSQAHVYGAFYFATNVASIASTIRLISFLSNGALVGRIGVVNGNQGFQFRNSADAAIGTISGTISANTVYRVEFDVLCGASGSGTLTVYLGDSTTPLGTASFSATSFGTTINQVRYGANTAAFSTTAGNAFWLDDLNVNAVGVPGPGPYTSGPITYSRPVTDTGATITDSVIGAAGRPVGVTDQGVSAGGPTSYLVDTYTRTVGSGGWGTADSGTGWATPASQPTAFSVNGSQGLIATVGGNTYRIFAGQSRTAIETRFSFSFPVATSTSASLQLLPAVRVQDTSNLIRAQILLSTTGALQLQIQEVIAGVNANIGGGIVTAYGAGGYVANEVWHCKMREQAGANGRVDVVIWKDGTTEPAYTTAGGSGSLGVFTSMSTGGGTAPSAGWTTGDFGITISSGAGNPATTITIDDFNASDGSSGASDTVAVQRVVPVAVTATGTSITDTITAARPKAVTDTGASITSTVTLSRPRSVTDTGTGPELYAADTGGHTSAVGWGNLENGSRAGQAWVTLQGSTSRESATGSALQVQHVGAAGSFTDVLGAGLSVADVEAYAEVQASDAAPNQPLDLQFVTRWTASTDVLRIGIRVLTSGSWQARIDQIVGGVTTTQDSLTIGTFAANTPYSMRVRLIGQNWYVKIWKTSTTEPGWITTLVNNNLATADSYSAWLNTGTLSAAGDVGFRFFTPAAYTGTVTYLADNFAARNPSYDTVGAVFTPGGGASFSRTPSDTGVTITSSAAIAAVRALASTGASITSSVAAAATRGVASTGTTITDSVARLLTAPRPITDTGTTVTSSVASSVAYARTATDTGTTITSAVVVAASRGPTDTGSTITSTVTPTQARPVTSTGSTITDSVATARARGVVDTGTTTTDSIVRTLTAPRGPTDTGTTTTSTVATAAGRAVTTTGVTISDTVVGARAYTRTPTDTGTTTTSTVSVTAGRGIADTGTTTTSSVGTQVVRGVSDTVTITDSVAGGRGFTRTVTDTGTVTTNTIAVAVSRGVAATGATITDTVARLLTASRAVTDTGTTITSAAAPTQGRAVADTGTTITSSVATTRNRAVTDTITITDTVARALTAPRPITDTGANVTSTVSLTTLRGVSDVGAVVTSSVATQVAAARQVTDTGLSQSDSVQRAIVRPVADTGVTVTSIVSLGGAVQRTVTDTGVTVTTSIRLATTRPITDTGTIVTSSTATVAARGITDTGVANRLISYDPFTRVVAAGLGSDPQGQAWTSYSATSPSTAFSSVDGAQAVMNVATANVRKVSILTSVPQMADSDTQITFTLRPTPTGATLFYELAARAQSPSDNYAIRLGQTTTASFNITIQRRVANVATQVGGVVNVASLMAAGDTVTLRLVITGGDTPSFQGYVWKVGTPAPTTPNLTTSDPTPITGTGWSGISISASTGNTDTPFTQAFDNFLLQTYPNDSVAALTTRPRAVTDTGTTTSDAVSALAAHPRGVVDAGTSITSSVALTRPVGVAATGTAITDTVLTERIRPVAATGATITDSVARRLVAPRVVTDTVTITDTVSGAGAGARFVTDQGATITSSVQRSVQRGVAATGVTITDSVNVTRFLSIAVSTQGATITDSVGRAAAGQRSATDQGATITDVVASTAAHPRTISDTGSTITSTTGTQRVAAFNLTSTGASITTSVAALKTFHGPHYDVVDQGATITSTLTGQPARFRPISDAGPYYLAPGSASTNTTGPRSRGPSTGLGSDPSQQHLSTER